MKRVGSALFIAVLVLAWAPSANAGVATYTSTNVPLDIPDGSTTDSVLAVPAGRTAIQSIEVTNYGYDWPASGQELSARLFSPDGASMFLFEVGCFDSPANASFTLTDSAALPLPEDNDCDDPELLGGSFRPVDPQNKTLSFFAGKAPSGTWTLRSVDNGVAFTNQGDLERWSLRIVHAPPTLSATGPGTARAGGALALTATSNANGTVVTGGDANPASTNLAAGAPSSVPYQPNQPILKRIKKKGKATATITLSFTDETGGVATSSVTVELTGKKAKKKRKKKGRKKGKKKP